MREPSNMIVIPKNIKEIDDPAFFLENIKKSETVSLFNSYMDE